MPRKLRLQYPGALHHVLNRGDQRENIFRDEADHEGFLSALGEACGKTEWQVHANYLIQLNVIKRCAAYKLRLGLGCQFLAQPIKTG